MIINKIIDENYHSNGKISYRATRAVLSKSHAHLYQNRRTHPDGYSWIYIGLCGKWDKNGKQKWVINYSEQGEILI
jgi:hypothetical protein